MFLILVRKTTSILPLKPNKMLQGEQDDVPLWLVLVTRESFLPLRGVKEKNKEIKLKGKNTREANEKSTWWSVSSKGYKETEVNS